MKFVCNRSPSLLIYANLMPVSDNLKSQVTNLRLTFPHNTSSTTKGLCVYQEAIGNLAGVT